MEVSASEDVEDNEDGVTEVDDDKEEDNDNTDDDNEEEVEEEKEEEEWAQFVPQDVKDKEVVKDNANDEKKREE